MLTMQEVVRILGVSRPTVYSMIAEGYLHPAPYSPALKRPRKHYFRPEEVERVLRERGRRAASMQRKAS